MAKLIICHFIHPITNLTRSLYTNCIVVLFLHIPVIRENHHTSGAWNWYHWVAIAFYLLKCWIVLKNLNNAFTFCNISWILVSKRRPNSHWNNPICCLYCKNHVYLCLGDLSSQAISRHVIDQIIRNIPSVSSEELTDISRWTRLM